MIFIFVDFYYSCKQFEQFHKVGQEPSRFPKIPQKAGSYWLFGLCFLTADAVAVLVVDRRRG
jgi:hypothetical protein